LARTKTQLEAEFVFEQDRLSTQSYYLGILATVGLGIETIRTKPLHPQVSSNVEYLTEHERY
jgi:hypothetical protein